MGQPGGFFLKHQGNKSAPVEINQEVGLALNMLFSKLKEGYSVHEVECILFAPRMAGKYKSACIAPSKEEPGSVRISVDIH